MNRHRLIATLAGAALVALALPALALGHTASGDCGTITLDKSSLDAIVVTHETPADWTAVVLGPVAGNHTYPIAAGTYDVRWTDNVRAYGIVVTGCQEATPTPEPTPTPTATPDATPTPEVPAELTGSGACNTEDTGGFLDRYRYTFHGTPGAVVDVADEATFAGPLGIPLDAAGDGGALLDQADVWIRYRGSEAAGIHVVATACETVTIPPDFTLPPTDTVTPAGRVDPDPDLTAIAFLLGGIGLAAILLSPSFARRIDR